jgi:hypothetical protein
VSEVLEAGGEWRGRSAPVARPADRRLDWRRELTAFGLITVFSALVGGAVGPIWHAVAPQLNLVSANDGSAAATKVLIGDDLWLGLVGILAGVACVLVLAVVARAMLRGPGAVLGLAAGGFLGSLVAAHLGHRVGHHQMVAGLATAFPHAKQHGIRLFLSYYDFRVRARAVLLGWPLAAVAGAGLVSLADQVRDAWRG